MDSFLDIVFWVGVGVASNFVYDWLKNAMKKH